MRAGFAEGEVNAPVRLAGGSQSQCDAMDLKHLARAGFAALTAPKLGPSLYDLCDPLLRGEGPGDAHLRKFYKTAVANPLLRPLLARAGLP